MVGGAVTAKYNYPVGWNGVHGIGKLVTCSRDFQSLLRGGSRVGKASIGVLSVHRIAGALLFTEGKKNYAKL